LTTKQKVCILSLDEIVSFLKEQVKIENQIVKSLDESIVEIENPAVKGVLKWISLDSMKHAQMYIAAIELMKASKALSQLELDKQKSLIEKHIKMEMKLISRISEKISKIKDEKVKLLLDAILSDEKRHHKLLMQVLKIIVRGETITEEEWFDVMWRSVPFHGAPGG